MSRFRLLTEIVAAFALWSAHPALAGALPLSNVANAPAAVDRGASAIDPSELLARSWVGRG